MAAPQRRLLRCERLHVFTGPFTSPIIDQCAVPLELFLVDAEFTFPLRVQQVGPVPGTILLRDHRRVVAHDEVARVNRCKRFFLIFGIGGITFRFGSVIGLKQVSRFQQTHFHAAHAQDIREILTRGRLGQNSLAQLFTRGA